MLGLVVTTPSEPLPPIRYKRPYRSRHPGRPPGRTVKGATARLHAVLSAAEQCDDQGWERTRLDDVACDVGVVRGALYRYFPTKDDLGLAVLEHGARLWTAAARGVIERSDTPADAPALLGSTLSRAALEHPSMRVVTTLAVALRDGPHEEAARELVAACDDAAAEAIEHVGDLAFRAAVAREVATRRGRSQPDDLDEWARRSPGGTQLGPGTQLALARMLRAAAAEVGDGHAAAAYPRMVAAVVDVGVPPPVDGRLSRVSAAGGRPRPHG